MDRQTAARLSDQETENRGRASDGKCICCFVALVLPSNARPEGTARQNRGFLGTVPGFGHAVCLLVMSTVASPTWPHMLLDTNQRMRLMRIQEDMSPAVGLASFLRCSHAVLSMDRHQKAALQSYTDVRGRNRGCQAMALPISMRSRGSTRGSGSLRLHMTHLDNSQDLQPLIMHCPRETLLALSMPSRFTLPTQESRLTLTGSGFGVAAGISAAALSSCKRRMRSEGFRDRIDTLSTGLLVKFWTVQSGTHGPFLKTLTGKAWSRCCTCLGESSRE